MHKSQKTGTFIKSAKVTKNASNPSFALIQPGSIVYAPAAKIHAVFKDQGNAVIPFVPTVIGHDSKTALPLIGNGIVGVFENKPATTKHALIRFTTYNVLLAGNAAVEGLVGFSIGGDVTVLTDTTGNSISVGGGVGGVTASSRTGHIGTDSVTGVYDGEVTFDTVGLKFLILQYGNESYVLSLTVV